MEINVLPSKYCTFRCVFCPIEQKGTQTGESFRFGETDEFLPSLIERLDAEKPDTLFINSMGESFANSQLGEIITLAKKRNVKVSLYTNGYLLKNPEYASLAALCDEVSGEIKAVSEESFLKLQRPMEGYSLKRYLDNMVQFRKSYSGLFSVYVTLLKNYNDDPESVGKISKILSRLKPDKVFVETFHDGKFGKAFGVSAERLEKVRQLLREC